MEVLIRVKCANCGSNLKIKLFEDYDRSQSAILTVELCESCSGLKMTAKGSTLVVGDCEG